ncbi:MAG TPA: 3'-5' exonuclease, partial [Anaerolineales bacterium]|nr:3'-5' exonuclease [Anaerolineales bacterium]
LLRLHPAEAGVDPRFAVLEEGLAAALKARAIDSALAWAASDPETARLFTAFKESELRRILGTLIEKRLDAANLFHDDPLANWERELRRWLAETLSVPDWTDSLASLSGHHSFKEDKLELARQSVLAHWNTLQTAQAAAKWDAALDSLRELRGATKSNIGQTANWDAAALDAVRSAMQTLSGHYDKNIAPVIPKGGCRWELDQQTAELLPALRRLFDCALSDYHTLKDNRLDFDDLEHLTARLLTTPPPSEKHPTGEGPGVGVRAVLVDEFQDTNDRQRQIVYALAGFNAPFPKSVSENVGATLAVAKTRVRANLFIVGDAKQGIYRFRGADVAVFRRIQDDITHNGGGAIDLDLTFRAHAALLDLINHLLAPLMGETDDPIRPHRVPFAPLTAHRPQPRKGVSAPFVEFHIGAGDAGAGRRAATAALATRLHELRAQEGFEWGDIALLFRASTAFPVYEDALETSAIPFVTVAGKGFYDRPEIRDLLNALAAIADPTDDLALAGLLRSPAFALTDSDLYHLRFPGGDDIPQPLYQSLREASNLSFSHVADIIAHLHTLSGRLPVAELLKRFLDLTHYRAILKSADSSTRFSRNVDKLLADAHRSRLVAVGDFLEYVQSLRDVGAREGEAPADPSTGSGGGAVQIMTVHKAKGLEFPLVVIADAAYDHTGGSDAVQLDPDLGVLLKVQTPRRGVSTAGDSRPFAWQFGARADADREEAENLRLLYVAVTRAIEKIIVSGHAKISAAKNDPGRLLLTGWLKLLGEVIGLDAARVNSVEAPAALPLSSEWQDSVTTTLHPPPSTQSVEHASRDILLRQPELTAQLGPLATTTFSPPPSAPVSEEEQRIDADPPPRVWRVVAPSHTPPAWVVGKLVHEALRRWTFPDAANIESRLRPTAVASGLTDEAIIREALREARRLLERFRAHPLFAELDAATERHHEIPYVTGSGTGIIDVLYRSPSGWTIADFKTDEARDEAKARDIVREEKYDAQLRRYADAAAAQLGQRPRTLLVFLNVGGEVRVITPESDNPC